MSGGTALARYDAARRALQVASSVDEVKDIRDKAQAMAAYARQAQDTELMAWATELKVRAERRAGEMLAGMVKLKGRPSKVYHRDTLSDLGVSRLQSSRWQKIAALPEAEFERVVAKAKTEAELVTTAALLRKAREDRDERLRAKDTREHELEPQAAGSNYAVKRGDLWTLGRHRLLCGDVYAETERQALIADLTIDALITDPPYGIAYQPAWKKANGLPSDFHPIIGDDKPFDPTPFLDYPTVAIFGANYFAHRLPVGGWICWDKRLKEEADAMFGAPFELAWFRSTNTSKRAIMVRCLHGGLINADTQPGMPAARRWHPTQKPVLVMEEIIRKLTAPASVVLDPFVGAGATLLACERTGNVCCAMEIEPQYCEIVLQRWCDATGREPVKVST